MPDLVIYKKLALTGGGATALDGIDGADLVGNELAFVTVSNILYHYLLNATSGAAESSPDIISPDVNPGDKRWILQGVEGADISDNDSSQTLSTTAFAKSQDAVLMRDPDQGVALTAATSGGGITITDNNNIDFGTGNFALVWKGSLPDWQANAKIVFSKWVGSVGYQLYISGAGYLASQFNGLNHTSSLVNSFIANSIHELAIVFTFGVTNTTADFYADGVPFGTQQTVANVSSVSNAADLQINGYVVNRHAGTVHHAYLLNFAPTAAEVLDMYRNGIPESWKYGSQTSIITGNDSTFAGASNWANVDLNAYDETTDLTITATASGQYCTLPVANAGTTATKKYRLEMDVANIVSTWTIKSFDGTQTIGTISANGTAQKIEFTASTTGGLRIVAAANDSSGDFDNILLYQIGATLLLGPAGIRPDRWIDEANGNHATYPTSGYSLTKHWSYADLQAAADNAAAAALSPAVPVGGLYRTNADPSVICVRTA